LEDVSAKRIYVLLVCLASCFENENTQKKKKKNKETTHTCF
jgi:hypothetical protein